MHIQDPMSARRLLRKAESLRILGDRNTTLYEKIKRGTMVRPVPIGGRAVAFPSDEVQAIVAARIAGASEPELRALVDALHDRRRSALSWLMQSALDSADAVNAIHSTGEVAK